MMAFAWRVDYRRAGDNAGMTRWCDDEAEAREQWAKLRGRGTRVETKTSDGWVEIDATGWLS